MKNWALPTAALLVILILFNAIAFIAPFWHTTAFWTGYGFTTLAALIAFFGTRLARQGDDERAFMRLPSVLILWGYFIVQAGVGLHLMASPLMPLRMALLACVVPLLLACAALLASATGTRHAEAIAQRRGEKTFRIESLLIDVEGLEARTDDPVLRMRLHELAEAIRYSNPMSPDGLSGLEDRIDGKTAELGAMVAEGDAAAAQARCREIMDLLAERSRRCKLPAKS